MRADFSSKRRFFQFFSMEPGYATYAMCMLTMII